MLETAIEAAAEAGKLLRKNFGSRLNVNETSWRDIKLEIDVDTQRLISKIILSDYPDHCILGEEEIVGNKDADVRWVVDPLDGTVNYFYNIPHYAVSIAAQVRQGDTWTTTAGVVLDPELEELFIATPDTPATLNGVPIRVSPRTAMAESIVAIGFFKSQETVRQSLEVFGKVIGRVRKIRLQGAAALDVVYVASGRYDVYIEHGIKLWDIAAGECILKQAGGKVVSRPTKEPHSFDVCMWNGLLPVTELVEWPGRRESGE